MSNKENHRRKNKPKVDRRYDYKAYQNGYARSTKTEICSGGEVIVLDPIDGNQRGCRTGRTGYLDKSMHGWGVTAVLSDRRIGACIGNDFCNGHRGMAAAVKGAKKFVRTRTRFHENAATKKMSVDIYEDDC